MANYHCLLLDVDGTLLDFDAAEHKAFCETMENFGLPAGDAAEQAYRAVNRELWAALEKGRIRRDKLVTERFARLLNELGAQGDPAQINEYYLDRLAEHPDPVPGALEAVKELAEVATLAVVTNGVEHVQRRRLADSGLEKYMDGVFISQRLGVEKPSRRFFEIALKQLGVENRSKVLVVGDSLTADVQGAKNAGLAACWFDLQNREAPAENGPEFIARSWQELYAIVMEPEELAGVGLPARKHQFDGAQ